jgi:uncharacterized protein
MERLISLSKKKAAAISAGFRRYLYDEIDWNQRLIVITGQRGSGKTTLLLQQLKQRDKMGIYLSLDDIWFEMNRLVTLVDRLYNEGYRVYYLDEVHRYVHWSKDLKNVYDNYPDVQVVVTGSSILELSKGREDLSRRAAVYHLAGLSFREFLQLRYNHSFDIVPLDEILKSHHEVSAGFHDRADIFKTYSEYIRYGYYPFFKEGIETYPQKLREMTGLVLDVDIAPFEELNHTTVRNMKKLIYVISRSVPFKPNISKLADRLDVPRNSVLKILDLLHRAEILSLLRSDTKGISYLQKPEKIYLHNPNLAWLFSEEKPETGNLRETFFLSQLRVRHHVTSSRFADFMVDEKWTFEIGGPGKTTEQIRGVPNAWIAADGIKGGTGKFIPLWLFGFLY